MRHLTMMFLLGCASAGSPTSSDPGETGGDDGTNPDGTTDPTDPGNNDPTEPGGNNDPTFSDEHPRIYLGTQRQRLTDALAAHTPAATRFVQTVDQWIGGEDWFAFPAWNAALLGNLTNDAHYCTAAIAAIETQVTAAEARIAQNEAPEVARDSYLYIGEEVGDVALTYDWCYDALTASQRTRWVSYAHQAVWNVWHHETAKWGSATIPWTGWSVDNPSNNYYYSFLRATLFLGLATQDMDLINKFRDEKIADQLVPTFDDDLVGGGSREGTGYGQSMRRLFELYDFWQASTGERIADLTQHTKASMLAYVHETMPTLDRTAPIGDHSRDSTSSYFDYDRDYLQKLVALYPSSALAGRVKAMLAESSVPQMQQGFMRGFDFLYERPDVTSTTLDGLDTTYHMEGIGLVATRSDWSKTATWLGLIAGPYTESHAHQDQGSIMIFKNDWLSYDSCHDTHSGVRQELGQHSMVRFERGGQTVQQHANTTSTITALDVQPDRVHIAADVTAAYDGDSDIQRVEREVVFLKPDVIVVYDHVQSTVPAIWSLVSPSRPTLSGGTSTFAGMTVQRVSPATNNSVYDFAANDSDYIGGYRLDEAAPAGDNRFMHVISTGPAVQIVSSTPTSVTISFNGHTETVTF